jgi:hypothetical protein
MDSSAFTASPLWVCKNRKNFKFVLAIEDSTYSLQLRPPTPLTPKGTPARFGVSPPVPNNLSQRIILSWVRSSGRCYPCRNSSSEYLNFKISFLPSESRVSRTLGLRSNAHRDTLRLFYFQSQQSLLSEEPVQALYFTLFVSFPFSSKYFQVPFFSSPFSSPCDLTSPEG